MMGREPASIPGSPGFDLMLRIVEEEVRAKRCPECAGSLADCEINLRDLELDRVVAEVSCHRCNRTVLMTIAPESEPGVASVR